MTWRRLEHAGTIVLTDEEAGATLSKPARSQTWKVKTARWSEEFFAVTEAAAMVEAERLLKLLGEE